MELQGETLIAAPRERVWAALNDPAVLRRCIDGVESLEKVGDSRFEGKLNAKVGPVRASFTGGVDLQNLDPPNRYSIVGEGKGGVAGFAKGSADVTLSDAALPDGSMGTQLAYVARSTVGGKLAQLGARLIEGTARGYAETFFARLKAEVEAPAPTIDDGTPAEDAGAAEIPTTLAAEGPTPPMAARGSATKAPVSTAVWLALVLLILLVASLLMVR